MLSFLADRVENPANLARIADAARLFGGLQAPPIVGALVAVENLPHARAVYGRPPLKSPATLAVGNERRGLTRGILRQADEVVLIPTLSRRVTTLNVAAAAAVAAWYVLRGSASQHRVANPDQRRPSLLIVGDNHVEIGSTLRSAAAFGFKDVLLDDRGCGWFDGTASIRREAFAAARRHKNSLRVHRGALGRADVFDEIVLVVPHGAATPLKRTQLARGARQLVVVGARYELIGRPTGDRVRVATLDLCPLPEAPLRLDGSIALAEIARQVGRRQAIRGKPAPRAPRYTFDIPLESEEDVVLLEPEQLLTY